jgi:hypothetical protein
MPISSTGVLWSLEWELLFGSLQVDSLSATEGDELGFFSSYQLDNYLVYSVTQWVDRVNKRPPTNLLRLFK